MLLLKHTRHLHCHVQPRGCCPHTSRPTENHWPGGGSSSSSSSNSSSSSRVVLARATAGGDDADAPKPDIDQLAAFLTAKAVEMRASFDEQDLPLIGLDAEAGDAAGDTPAAAAESVRAFASMDEAVRAGAGLPGDINPMSTLDVLESVPDERGFIPQDFAILKLLGRLGMQDAATQPPSGSSSPGRSVPALNTPSILVYAARYISGLPYQGPVTVQLREYLPSARGVAKNELLVLKRLCGKLPQEKWQAAAKEPDSSCPAVRLLGYLEAPPSDEAFELCEDPADTFWLVYKFEALRPLTLALQQMDLPEEPTGFSTMFMKKEHAVALALRSRRTLLQRIAQGLLQALSYCHSRGVAHCGLGPGCVVVNTWRDRDADRLLVKWTTLGWHGCTTTRWRT
ncbi:hypothetical protein COO60DRAFT_1632418 [Scenedesmus sp. NREL 46B-D3]|nr:hypothetical protein COO60DRAFT_1632418 [Scenedesmus sp. NREL 46B-D3]